MRIPSPLPLQRWLQYRHAPSSAAQWIWNAAALPNPVQTHYELLDLPGELRDMIWTFSLLGEDGIQFAPYKATSRHPLLRTSRQTRTELLEAMLRLDTELLLPSTALTRLHGADIFGLIQRFTRYSLRLGRMREWGSVPVFLMWYRRTGRGMMAMVWGYGDAPGSRHFISLPWGLDAARA
ncbi:hypothetical protein LTR27_008066 [Elasticomyces elasticus]|nr:hypothetical protein LTR27_008066 [Elasticomyces elasticus]